MLKNRTAKILVVDDDRIVRLTLENLLRKAGHQVVCAENGLRAVVLCSEYCFDIAIFDMNMPQMDGWTAVSQLRMSGVEFPIIAYTTYSLPGDEARAKSAGCTLFLGKPADPGKVMETIGAALGWDEKPNFN